MKKLLLLFLLSITLFFTSCNKGDDYILKISSPAGSPAVSLVDLKENKSDKYDITLGLSPDTLQSLFVKNEMDVIVAPINLGMKLYTKSENYRLASVITWGNLYIASSKPDFKLEDINSNEIFLFGENTITAEIVKYTLNSKGITPNDITYLENTALTQAKLISTDSIVMIAEPALSAASTKKEGITSYSIQDLYKEITGLASYPQAACFIKADTITNHKSVVDQFLTDLEASVTKCNTNVDEIAALSAKNELGVEAVLKNAIPNSNISYKDAKSSINDIKKIMEVLPTIFSGTSVENGIIYEG